MSAFTNDEIQNILKLWKGQVKIHKQNNEIVKIELSRRYDFDFFPDNEELPHNRKVINTINRVINGYNFLKVEGDQTGIVVNATVKPDSIKDFQFYCSHLKRFEKTNK